MKHHTISHTIVIENHISHTFNVKKCEDFFIGVG